jgi:hypothetical protein
MIITINIHGLTTHSAAGVVDGAGAGVWFTSMGAYTCTHADILSSEIIIAVEIE